ncbi:unnamed protein product [Phytophthora lilii]|uniref:RxLR effector protein n=1 Tax=Phytophthora lilii TaxID=2077276 RepID=A0A9W6U3K1_9STRA|nr:unnamed protein product [Phytophthora lilii]
MCLIAPPRKSLTKSRKSIMAQVNRCHHRSNPHGSARFIIIAIWDLNVEWLRFGEPNAKLLTPPVSIIPRRPSSIMRLLVIIAALYALAIPALAATATKQSMKVILPPTHFAADQGKVLSKRLLRTVDEDEEGDSELDEEGGGFPTSAQFSAWAKNCPELKHSTRLRRRCKTRFG